MKITSIMIAVLCFFSGAIYIGITNAFESPPTSKEEITEYIKTIVQHEDFAVSYEAATRAEMLEFLEASGFDTSQPELEPALENIIRYTVPIYREHVRNAMTKGLTTEEVQTLWEIDRGSKPIEGPLRQKLLQLAYRSGTQVGNRPDVQQYVYENLKKVYPDI